MGKMLTLSDELYNELLALAKEVSTQKNCCTAKPITHEVHRPVAQHSENPDAVSDGGMVVYYYDTEFYEKDEILEYFGEKTADDFDDDDDDSLDDYVEKKGGEKMYRWYENEIYDLCGTFLTRKGAQHFIDCNKHHVGNEAFIFVNHAWRNGDAETIQKLMEELWKK